MGNIYNAIGSFFYPIIVKPLLNLLIVLYSIIPYHDFGLAVIAITVVVRFILWPLSGRALHSQKAMKALQPEIDKIKKRHKGNPQAAQKALTELYKEKEIHPLSSCLPTLLQLPIFFGLYFVFSPFKSHDFVQLADASKGILTQLYPFVKGIPTVKSIIEAGGSLNTTLLGVVDLAKPNIFLGIIAGAVQFVQTKMMTPKQPQDPTQQAMAKTIYIFPLMTVFISIGLPSALPLYWAVSTVVAAYQQWLILHKEVSLFEHLKIKKKNG